MQLYLPELDTATTYKETICKEYKSGAKFDGAICEQKKTGHGTFIWPNGAKYVGEYKNNARFGKGTQFWPDGSEYTGDFVDDLRHGTGIHKWSNGEVYQGDFYQDCRHGLGLYTWPDKQVYDGPFYMDKKHGYGQFTFPDGRVFQGLYREDERDGPGMMTYPDGRQDVGFWRRERLVKLCTEIKGCFTANKSQVQPSLDAETVAPDTDISNQELVTKSPIALRHQDFEKAYFDKLHRNSEPTIDSFVWNSTPTLMAMQRHMILHQPYAMSSIHVNDICSGKRDKFGEKGLLEELSESLITASLNNDLFQVENIIQDGRIHVDVADSKGRTSLLSASVTWNQSIINYLLDNGADINQVSDEGVSPLTACAFYFYPESRFKKNLAESEGRSSKGGGDKDRKADDKHKGSHNIDSIGKDRDKKPKTAAESSSGDSNPTSGFASNVTLLPMFTDQLPDQNSNTSVQTSDAKKSLFKLMEDTIRLLLKRGADPNSAHVPMPVLYYALKAADVDMVRELLMKNASCTIPLSENLGGLYPLHFAAGTRGPEGVELMELLLNSLADPDARATPDDSYLSKTVPCELYSKDPISDYSKSLLGGRAPLHIACNRQSDHKNASAVVRLLLDHRADPNLLCNGHSPLSLAVASGNDMAVEELLSSRADPSVVLTHGLGCVLAVDRSTNFRNKRSLDDRIQLLNRLVGAGANILALMPIGSKRSLGTAVDYAHFTYNLDRRIAHTPYHALTPREREIVNERKTLLAHVGSLLREKIVERDLQKLAEEEKQGKRSRPASSNFVYKRSSPTALHATASKNGVSFGQGDSLRSDSSHDLSRRHAFKCCYECGRSLNVRLAACTRCKEVYYCGKVCKLKAWDARHKDECIRVEDQVKRRENQQREHAHPMRGARKVDKSDKGSKSDKIDKVQAEKQEKMTGDVDVGNYTENYSFV